VPPVPVGDVDGVDDEEVCFMDSGSTIKPSSEAFFRTDIASFTLMLSLNTSTRSTITLPHL